MEANLQQLNGSDAYALFIQLLVPRPIAWVLTANDGGKTHNLAPYSFFGGVSGDPPMVALGIGRKENGAPKDTWANIKVCPDYVIHVTPQALANEMVQTAASLPYGESELSLNDVNLELEAVPNWPLPRIKQAPVAFLCERHKILELGNDKNALIIGEVVAVYVDDSLVIHSGGRTYIDTERFAPLARLGGQNYASIGKPFSIPRPR